MRLSDYAVGRDNNFNLIRLLAALSVIFSHSIAVLGLPGNCEVFFDRLGLSAGEMAVDVFFVASGFLVTGSLVNRGSLIAFLWARTLRIYPALWVMLALTVFVLAPALTTLPVADYLRAPGTYEYFWKCATLIGGVRYSLPGVFETMPLKGEFNGSLWTLPIELRMYLYLAAGWFVLAAVPAIRVKALTLAAPVAAGSLPGDHSPWTPVGRPVQRRPHSRVHVPRRNDALSVARQGRDEPRRDVRSRSGAGDRLVQQVRLLRGVRPPVWRRSFSTSPISRADG